mmetsp:Transcript_31625/g.85722  ORF Transcript_31625/g.85722 Transcript_31625/m.85722 type:complete len:192 (+) Transcript_31625:63-638(+)
MPTSMPKTKPKGGYLPSSLRPWGQSFRMGLVSLLSRMSSGRLRMGSSASRTSVEVPMGNLGLGSLLSMVSSGRLRMGSSASRTSVDVPMGNLGLLSTGSLMMIGDPLSFERLASRTNPDVLGLRSRLLSRLRSRHRSRLRSRLAWHALLLKLLGAVSIQECAVAREVGPSLLLDKWDVAEVVAEVVTTIVD